MVSKFQEANLLLRTGKLEEAAIAYRAATEENSGFYAAYQNLGETLWKLERLDEAVEALRRAVALNPRAVWGLYKLGELLRLRGEFEEAAGYLRRAVELKSDVAEFHLGLGAALVKLGELKEGEGCLRRVMQFPTSSIPTSSLAEAYYYLGVAKSQQQQWSEAVEWYRRGLELNPAAVDCCLALARALGQLGRWSEAVDCYRQVVALSESGEVLFALGKALAELRRFEEAIAEYQRAIALGFADAEVRHHLGYAFSQLGRYEEAVVELRQVLEVNPKSAQVRHQLGYALMRLQRWREAAVELRKVVELNPGSAVVWQQLDFALSSLNTEKGTNNIIDVEVEHKLREAQNEFSFNEESGGEYKKLRVLLLNTNNETRNAYLTISIYRALKRNPAVKQVTFVGYHNAVSTAQSRTYDIFLAIDGQRLNREICSRVATYIKLAALWTFEDPYGFETNVKNADIFDLVFSNDQASSGKYPVTSVHLPLAGSKDDIGIDKNKEFRYDIFFCGTAWPNRVEILDNLLRDRPNLKSKIVLQYSQYIPQRELFLPSSSYKGSLTHKTFLCFAQHSRIVIGLPRKYGGSKDGFDNLESNTPAPRIFECAAVGAFQLVNEQNSNISQFFDVGREIDTYTDYTSLVEKIDYWLANPEKRLKIAEESYKRACKEHLYNHRIQILLDQCRQLLRKLASQLSIQERSTVKNKRPRLLFICHNTLISSSFGGLEIHQNVLCQNLLDAFDIFFFYKHKDQGKRVTYRITDANYNPIEEFILGKIEVKFNLSNETYEKKFADILIRYRIDLVHFFHFINHLPSYALVAKALGVPYTISVHDYYLACIKFNLLDYTNRYCENSGQAITQCDVCLSATDNIAAGSQATRRAFYGRVLDGAFRIITVSKSTADILTRIYPQLEGSGKVFPHGAPLPSRISVMDQRIRTPDQVSEKLKIVVFGNLAPHKGSDAIVRAMNFLRNDPVSFDIFGIIDGTVEKQISNLNLCNATIHGAYVPGSLNLANYDVSLHLSIWPETHCQTLSEAWMGGLVPIVTDIGALGERVIDGVTGYKIPVNSPSSLISIIRRLIKEPYQLDDIRSNVTDDLVFTQSRHQQLFRETYLEAIESKKVNHSHDKTKVAVNVNLKLYGIELRHDRWDQK
ncbi:MAG: tetratricopeptide repeat protein [Lyngbya sp.]|nr:tetratricopeptide repeat protein [Lyngbya sp.]